jgi:hypothetical protein
MAIRSTDTTTPGSNQNIEKSNILVLRTNFIVPNPAVYKLSRLCTNFIVRSQVISLLNESLPPSVRRNAAVGYQQ